MQKKGEGEPQIINILADGNTTNNLFHFQIPYTSETEEFYKLLYSFATGKKYSDVIAPPKK